MGINDRFLSDSPGINFQTPVTPMIVYSSTTAVVEGDAADEVVASWVLPKGSVKPGMTFRVTMAGSKSGTNAAMGTKLTINSTDILTLTADDSTAVDWFSVAMVCFKTPAVQNCSGMILTDTADVGVDYAAGAVDCTSEVTLKAQITCGHASDEVTCSYAVVEYWSWTA